ncbi:MAG: Polyphenol oxidase [Candidatus Erwinia impunctatus]|nr:Polyphenol oxidase [Culicoides impunctatus]
MSLLYPEWSAPEGVCAASTTRVGGVSLGSWASLNLGSHVGDSLEHVQENRQRLGRGAGMASLPVWLDQVHGTSVLKLDGSMPASVLADAAYSAIPGVVCAVMTADCLPVLFCSLDGTEVAAAHAGWRGLANGVIEATLACFRAPAEEIIAWMGPAIGPEAFEVGSEVRDIFVAKNAADAAAFRASGEKYYADIWCLASNRLRASGVIQISGGGQCTFSNPARFFSYRREGITGRMASCIWRP